MNNINYFGEFFFKSIFLLIILFIFTNLWKAVYAGRPLIEGYTLAMMLWYTLMTESIVISVGKLLREINKEIQSGEVAYNLNKPYSYVLYHLSKSLSDRAVSFVATFSMGAVLVYLLVGGFEFNFMTIPLISISVLLAFILDSLIVIALALLGFWFEDTNTFMWIYSKINFTIGGMLVPLEIFPAWLKQISEILPFSFIAYYPAKIFVNFDIATFAVSTGMQLVYIIIFSAIVFLVYSAGIRRLNINGG